VRVLDELTTAERGQAEQIMLDHLSDRHAMRGLAYLRSARAVEPLRAQMRNDRYLGVHAAIALWDIRPDQEALALLCRTSKDRPLLRAAPNASTPPPH